MVGVMKNYIDTQNQVLAENPDVIINQNSTCWSRVHAHCTGEQRGMICKWKQAESYASTWLLFHEIGHVRTFKTTMTRAESESAATRWGMEQMRRSGLPVKRKQLNDYKAYVARCHDRAKRRGLKRKLKIKLLK